MTAYNHCGLGMVGRYMVLRKIVALSILLAVFLWLQGCSTEQPGSLGGDASGGVAEAQLSDGVKLPVQIGRLDQREASDGDGHDSGFVDDIIILACQRLYCRFSLG